MLGFKPKRTNLHEKYDYPIMRSAPRRVGRWTHVRVCQPRTEDKAACGRTSQPGRVPTCEAVGQL